MKVLTFLTRSALQRRIAQALRAAPFVVDTTAFAKECLQLAQFAQYEGILVDADSINFSDVLSLVKLLRQENSDASLFVFACYLDLEQRLGLFEAGADDCVLAILCFGVGSAAQPFDSTASGGFQSGVVQCGKFAPRR